MKITFLEFLVILSLIAIGVILLLPFILNYFGIPYDPTPLNSYDLYY